MRRKVFSWGGGGNDLKVTWGGHYIKKKKVCVRH